MKRPESNLFILTDSKWNAQNKRWGEAITHRGYFYAHNHPVVAIILNHNIKDPIIWRGYGEILKVAKDKLVCTSLTTLRIYTTPKINKISRMKFGFACVCAAYQENAFHNWANDWVKGDRDCDRAKSILDIISHNKYLSDNMWAAQWMAWAAYADQERLQNHYISLAIQHACIAKEIDLVKIAETIFSADK